MHDNGRLYLFAVILNVFEICSCHSGRSRRRRRGDGQGQADPQPGVAHRWISQARHDLDAVNCDQLCDNYEWACYKCHQV